MDLRDKAVLVLLGGCSRGAGLALETHGSLSLEKSPKIAGRSPDLAPMPSPYGRPASCGFWLAKSSEALAGTISKMTLVLAALGRP